MSGSLEPLSTEAIASGMQLYLQQGRKTKIKWHHSLTGNVLKERLWTRYYDLWQTTDNVFRNNPTNDSKPLNQNFYPINTAFPSFTDVILHFARANPPPPSDTHPPSFVLFFQIDHLSWYQCTFEWHQHLLEAHAVNSLTQNGAVQCKPMKTFHMKAWKKAINIENIFPV